MELKEDNIAVSVVYPYITLTDFEKNTIKDPSVASKEIQDGEREAWAKADSAQYVAELIVGAVESGAAAVYAHDWMKPRQ